MTLALLAHRPRRLPRGGRAALYAILLLAGLAAVLPFVYMVITSLETYGSAIANNLWPWPPLGAEALQLGNYPQAVQTIGLDRGWHIPLFFRYLANSAIVSGAIVLGSLVTSICAAYALARINLPGKSIMFLTALAIVMVPEDVTLVPKVVMMYDFHWYNTYLALTVPFLVNVFGIFLLRQAFLQIPRELFDAARLDGVGHLRFLFWVGIPLSRPAVVTTALLSFIWSWDSFKWPLLVTRDESMRVLSVGLQQFKQGEGSNVPLLMAFATLVVLPVVVLYCVAQKQFREGVMSAAVKG